MYAILMFQCGLWTLIITTLFKYSHIISFKLSVISIFSLTDSDRMTRKTFFIRWHVSLCGIFISNFELFFKLLMLAILSTLVKGETRVSLEGHPFSFFFSVDNFFLSLSLLQVQRGIIIAQLTLVVGCWQLRCLSCS